VKALCDFGKAAASSCLMCEDQVFTFEVQDLANSASEIFSGFCNHAQRTHVLKMFSAQFFLLGVVKRIVYLSPSCELDRQIIFKIINATTQRSHGSNKKSGTFLAKQYMNGINSRSPIIFLCIFFKLYFLFIYGTFPPHSIRFPSTSGFCTCCYLLLVSVRVSASRIYSV